jgi:aspartate/methionine/tyrosine aminotransferase
VLVLPESALEARPGADLHLRMVFARSPEIVETAVERLAGAWAAFRRSPVEELALARV